MKRNGSDYSFSQRVVFGKGQVEYYFGVGLWLGLIVSNISFVVKLGL